MAHSTPNRYSRPNAIHGLQDDWQAVNKLEIVNLLGRRAARHKKFLEPSEICWLTSQLHHIPIVLTILRSVLQNLCASNGGPGRIRTCNPPVSGRVLCPIELRVLGGREVEFAKTPPPDHSQSLIVLTSFSLRGKHLS